MLDYRERVIPPLWGFLLMLLLAPAAMIVFLPIDTTLGWIFAVLLVAAAWIGLVLASPKVSVADGTLRAGHASIPVSELGEAEAIDRESARQLLGRDFDPAAFYSTTPWTRTLVRVAVTDPDDPTPHWVISSRRPERLKAAIDAQRPEQTA